MQYLFVGISYNSNLIFYKNIINKFKYFIRICFNNKKKTISLQNRNRITNMQGYLNRFLENKVKQYENIFPVIAIIGPRQCGKSSLAKFIQKSKTDTIFLDLENDIDLNKIINDPALFFEQNSDKIIFLDEIQRSPEIFKTLRHICDKHQRNGWIYISGSSSPDLLKQSSESLAGRVGFLELTPFLISEIYKENDFDIFKHWLKGGFPKSYFLNENDSFIWIANYLRTFIERDIPMTGKNLSTEVLKRLLLMLTQSHANVVNWSKIGESLGVNYHTIQSYCDLLEKTFILRILKPFTLSTRKRMVKSPKIYFRDSGVFHQLIKTHSFNDLLGHQYYGASWEGYVIENIISLFSDFEFSFYRTATGVEIDLIMQKGNRIIAVECKASRSPQISRGFYEALEDLQIEEAWIICPIEDHYGIRKNVNVSGLNFFIENQMNSYLKY